MIRIDTPVDVYRISISKDYAVEGYLKLYEAKYYSALQPPRPSARGDFLSFWRNLTPAKKAGIEILALGVTEGRACLCILLATDEKFFKEFFSHSGNYETLGGIKDALKTNVGMTTFSSITLAGLIVIAGLYLYNSHKRSHSPVIESEAKQSRRVQHFPSIDEESAIFSNDMRGLFTSSGCFTSRCYSNSLSVRVASDDTVG